ncbi:nucleotidyltransferase family protein [Myceligenerans crystallogenes]|uniref:NTP transferase domain-containing protein n=1 Tax=Myceligenerans crystallogenes TaxID=316335 RepID=A0ABN2NFZ0_9MICO
MLAAGAGSRFGRPKALAASADGVPWVRRACSLLRDAGCERVVVTLGSRADEAAGLVPGGADVVVVPDWRDGMSASLRAGLGTLAQGDADVAVITLVDLPGLRADAIGRLLEAPSFPPSPPGPARAMLRRAAYGGRPGHPVVIGRDHWTAVGASVTGDRGAARYLEAHGAAVVDCTDLGGGDDVDAGPGARSGDPAGR